MKKTLALALTATLAVILSGCMRMHVNLTLEEDNKASGTMVFAISDEVAKQFDMEPQELFNSMLEQQGGASAMAPEGATATPYAEDGYTGTEWSFESKSLEEAGTGQDIKIIRDGDDYVVTGDLDMSDSGTEDPATAGLAESMDIAVSITFPGEVTEHNGTLNGKTVTWTPKAGENLSIEARGGATAGGSGSILPIVLIIVGALIIAGILWAVLGRKKKNNGDGPDYTYNPAAPTHGAPDPHNPTGSSESIPGSAAQSEFNHALNTAQAEAAPITAPNTDISNQSDYTRKVDEPHAVVEDTIEPPQRFPQPPVDPQNPENPQQ